MPGKNKRNRENIPKNTRRHKGHGVPRTKIIVTAPRSKKQHGVPVRVRKAKELGHDVSKKAKKFARCSQKTTQGEKRGHAVPGSKKRERCALDKKTARCARTPKMNNQKLTSETYRVPPAHQPAPTEPQPILFVSPLFVCLLLRKTAPHTRRKR